MASAFAELQACSTAMSGLERLWRPKDGRARSSAAIGLERRPPSSTPQDGAIWTCTVFVWYTGWALLPPVAFPDEATLHSLVEQAPQLLPLAGSPGLVIVGREVQLGSGWADLIALEPSGRVVLIEIKLARNAEARRAVVAQVLTYAAYLYGISPIMFERNVLGRHLQERGHDTLASAIASIDQEGAFDAEEFAAGLEASLSQGQFHLVIVLDAAPEELIRLIGYLEVVSDKLLIDLVTVASYDVGGSAILVPQRVDPERRTEDSQALRQPRRSGGRLVNGADDFVAAIDRAPAEEQLQLRKLAEWALALVRQAKLGASCRV